MIDFRSLTLNTHDLAHWPYIRVDVWPGKTRSDELLTPGSDSKCKESKTCCWYDHGTIRQSDMYPSRHITNDFNIRHRNRTSLES